MISREELFALEEVLTVMTPCDLEFPQTSLYSKNKLTVHDHESFSDNSKALRIPHRSSSWSMGELGRKTNAMGSFTDGPAFTQSTARNEKPLPSPEIWDLVAIIFASWPWVLEGTAQGRGGWELGPLFY